MGDAVDMMIASEYRATQRMTLRVNQFVTDAVVVLARCCALSWWLMVASPFLDRSLPGTQPKVLQFRECAKTETTTRCSGMQLVRDP